MKFIVLGFKSDMRTVYSDFLISKHSEKLYFINPTDFMRVCLRKSCELPIPSNLHIKETSHAINKWRQRMIVHFKYNISSLTEVYLSLKQFPSGFLDPPGIPFQNFVKKALFCTSNRYSSPNIVLILSNYKLRKIPIRIKFIRKLNQRIVPSLIRLADDLTGKEAGQEANIGDKQNVNKYIN